MLTKNLQELLLERNEGSNLNFTKLVETLENSEYEFIGTTLRGVMGLATYNKAYFDMSGLDSVDSQLIFFVILHEYCHVMAIDRMGKEGMITNLAEKDFDKFFNHIVGEEILADRFASLFYYHYNKRQYPRYRTQRLYDQDVKNAYADKILDIHGKVNDEESYDKLMEYFIIE